jgi:hypothetical protein
LRKQTGGFVLGEAQTLVGGGASAPRSGCSRGSFVVNAAAHVSRSALTPALAETFQRIFALRHSSHWMPGILMSALAPTADVNTGGAYVRFVP